MAIRFRIAEERDAKLLFHWANDPLVRNNSFNSKIILWEEHISWFKTKLENPSSCLILIVQDILGNDIGQIRFDKINNAAYIDFYVAEKYRGKGFGTEILKKSCKLIINKWKDIEQIIGMAKEQNISSRRSFIKANFAEYRNENVFIYKLLKKD